MGCERAVDSRDDHSQKKSSFLNVVGLFLELQVLLTRETAQQNRSLPLGGRISSPGRCVKLLGVLPMATFRYGHDKSRRNPVVNCANCMIESVPRGCWIVMKPCKET